MANRQSIRTMEAESLTRQAHQVLDSIKEDLPSQYKGEFKNIVDELTGRVEFVSSGQAPRTKTSYQALEASALAQQARHVVSQVSRNIPVEKRDSLELVETLADRVEFAAIGASAKISAKTPTKTGSRSGSSS